MVYLFSLFAVVPYFFFDSAMFFEGDGTEANDRRTPLKVPSNCGFPSRHLCVLYFYSCQPI